MLAGQAARFVVSAITFMLLARWLGKEPFGLLAMAELVTSVVLAVGGFGFGVAVVQRPTLDGAALNRLFRINLLLSVALWGGVTLGGAALALFFGRPVLVPLVATLGLGVLIDNAATLHAGLTQRRMRFAALARIEVGSVVLGCGAGLSAAAAGAGVWALAAQQGVVLTARSVGLVRAAGPWPGRGAGVAAADDPAYRALLAYGGGHTLARVVKELSGRLDQLVIGRLAGVASLGAYRNAHQWALLPLQQGLSPLTTVATAGACRRHAAGDAVAYRRYMRRAAEAAATVTVPAVVFMMVAAGPVVALVLGPDWAEAEPLLRILSVGLLAVIPTMLLKPVMYAAGRMRPVVQVNLMSAAWSVAGVAGGAAWGVPGIAWGVSLSRYAAAAVTLPWGRRGSAVTVADLVAPLCTPLMLSGVAGGAAWALTPAATRLMGSTFAVVPLAAVFGGLYAGLTLSLPGPRGRVLAGLSLLRRR